MSRFDTCIHCKMITTVSVAGDFRPGSCKCDADVTSLSTPSRQGAQYPVFLSYVLFPELSWCQTRDGSHHICNAGEI